MRLTLERRPEASRAMVVLSPVIAILLTVLAGAIIFTLSGLDPLRALHVYFLEPLTSIWALEQLLVKAAPLILIGCGLAICYVANVWNIGAEGQFTAGAILGGIVPVMFPEWQSPLGLLLMLALGTLGGMAYGAIPGAPQESLRHQRDPDEPDARLCRAAPSRLAGARALERPARLQFSQDRDLRGLAAVADHRTDLACRRVSRLRRWRSSSPSCSRRR